MYEHFNRHGYLQWTPEGWSLSWAPVLFVSSPPEDRQALWSAAADGPLSAKAWEHKRKFKKNYFDL